MAVQTPACTTVPSPPSQISIQLPGGITLKTMPLGGVLAATELSYVQSMMAQLAPALGVLQPIFILIDTVIALKDTVTAIPGLIALDVPPFTDALDRVASGVSKLVGMTPQASIPVLVRDLVAFLVAFLGAMETQLDVVIQAEADAADLLAAAAVAPDAYKADMVIQGQCAEDQAAALLEHAVAAIGPVQSILAIIGLLTNMVDGLPGMPEIGDLSGSTAEVKAAISALRSALDALPL